MGVPQWSAMRSTLTAILLLLIVTPTAGAASIAYVDGGEVWVSSLDGAQKARIATPVVNGGGETEKWLAVAASDSGRIVAARNVPDRSPSYSSFKVGSRTARRRSRGRSTRPPAGRNTNIRSAST